MIDQKKRMYHFEPSSLLPLKLVLIEAQKESPPQIWKEQKDRNEELASKLIASMRKKYRKVNVVARVIAQSNPFLTKEIASLTEERFARNDMKLEP
jgi:hypothetical protein